MPPRWMGVPVLSAVELSSVVAAELLSSAADDDPELLQAARLKAMAAASIPLTNFFMVYPS